MGFNIVTIAAFFVWGLFKLCKKKKPKKADSNISKPLAQPLVWDGIDRLGIYRDPIRPTQFKNTRGILKKKDESLIDIVSSKSGSCDTDVHSSETELLDYDPKKAQKTRFEDEPQLYT